MKQFRIYLALLCAMLLAAGCSKDMETETTRPTDAASLIKIGDFPAFDQETGTRATGIPDLGKTAWADGDKVLLNLQKVDKDDICILSLYYTLTYDGANARWNFDRPMNILTDTYDNRVLYDVFAYYAPAYEWKDVSSSEKPQYPSLKSGKTAGTDECLVFITFNQNLRDDIFISFEDPRPYSRLRVATQAGATVQFTPSNRFIAANPTPDFSGETSFTTTADANGNAFFYGKWEEGGKFEFIVSRGSGLLKVEKTITDPSTAGKSYAVDATQLIEVSSMSMTIDTRKNTTDPNDKTFILPISETLMGYSLFVAWGDGKISAFNDGTALDQNNMTHNYPQAGEYTITISSSQTDANKKQMPNFNSITYAPTINPKKLISLNSPLLNMGTSLFQSFYNCINLTTIPAGLFENNPLVTSFRTCFLGCTGLTAIPEKLFENNPLVAEFRSCFDGCTGLTAIPEGLFAKNLAATNFMSCFSKCSKLTTIPAGLFAKNLAATNFMNCFYNCSKLTTIPAGLFAKNLAATSFENCFDNCGIVVLNPNIFCNEATEKDTRFAGKTVNFSSCFHSCGNNAGAGKGGIAPALWNYKNMAGVTSTQCFYRATNVTNVGDIPADWK